MTVARKDVVEEGEVRFYHCISRCVRRAFLCGFDPYSKKSFDHRKEWVRSRLQELAGAFGVDIGGYAVMSNHLHVVIRTRPDLASKWSRTELAQRWWTLFPKRRNTDGTPANPKPNELKRVLLDEEGNDRSDELRERLSGVSWFMRCLSEYIARQANREDGCKGRFWEGRFKCQALLDDAAVLSCSAYVDLNPIRAGLSKSLQDSEYTSIQDRLVSEEGKEKAKQYRKLYRGKEKTTRQVNMLAQAVEDSERADWLCPVADNEKEKSIGFQANLTTEQYVELLDWTGRAIAKGKKGRIPEETPAALRTMEIGVDQWLATIKHYGSWYVRFVGSVDKLKDAAKRLERSWLHGQRKAREGIQAVSNT